MSCEGDDWREWERRQGSYAFARVEGRRSSYRRSGDCGHAIDRTEPYRYSVWKIVGDDGIGQRCDCEPCARADNRY